ncbi:MAG TPA: hypothetical protein VFZ21_31040, partial [Gemmatimonadaceae bacterium]|nr:hypothetical protein [Gemmatimonadaceae bacterium]
MDPEDIEHNDHMAYIEEARAENAAYELRQACGGQTDPQMTAVENPALSELLHSLRPGMSPMEQLSAVTRAYEIGRSERGQPEASSS